MSARPGDGQASEHPLRLAVYSDFAYRRDGDDLYAEQAFVIFMAALRESVDRLVLVGRLDPTPGRWHFRVPRGVELAALPHYARLSSPVRAATTFVRSMVRFWRVLDDVDCVWLMGPHPLSLAFAVLAAVRRRAVALGVRQDFPAYVRSRHPGGRTILAAAVLLEGLFRGLARRAPVVAVGADLAERYARAPRLLDLTVSLVAERGVVGLDDALARSYEGELRVISVGRLDAEKNPLLLADVLAELAGRADRWRLVVCGEGPLEGDLRKRLEALGVADRAELRGYVPVGDGLEELYRESHLFLHVSWTEGMPQVLIEAFAAGLPTVATDVGGVRATAGDVAVLVPAGDARAAADALARLADDQELRRSLVEAGLARARNLTLEAQARSVSRFLAGADGPP